MNTSEVIKYLILRTTGNFLVLFAMYGFFGTFGPALFFEIQYRVAQARGVQFQVADVTPTSQFGEVLEAEKLATPSGVIVPTFQDAVTGSKVQFLKPITTEFSLIIPKIGANARVIPNVDPSSEAEFLPALQKGVAHAKGSVFPGMKGNTYLFAHSTDNFWNVGRYNAIFYLLKDVSPGDDVVVFFENRRYNYTVTSSEIVNPDQVTALTKSQETGQEQLVMQTCWPPGTTWQRLIVYAKPK